MFLELGEFGDMRMSIPLNKLRSIRRLTGTTGFSNRRIAEILSVAPNTIRYYRDRFEREKLSWVDVQEMGDLELISRLCLKRKRDISKVMPNWSDYYERLSKNKHLTLEVLHEEYRAIHKEHAYSYTQFTHYYRKYIKKIDPTLRIPKSPAEIMQVDFAGTLIPWKDVDTGEENQAQIFVSLLGYSSYTFVCAVNSQKVRDFIDAHTQAFKFYGGIPESVLIDNLKAGVIKPGVDPVINTDFEKYSEYMGFVVLSTRPRKPKDKAAVENAVRFISRWITAKLLERTFFSIEEINKAIQELLPELNNRKMRGIDKSRFMLFEEAEKEKLKPAPSRPYQHFEYMPSQQVPKDYHIKVFGHWYSVPYQLVSERVDARASKECIEISHMNKLRAVHPRCDDMGGMTTDKAHMAPNHRAYLDQGLSSFSRWAEDIGPAALRVVQAQYEGKREHSAIANKACSGLKSLAKSYDKREFEAACARAVSISSPTLKSVKSILRTGLFKFESGDSTVQIPLPLHENVRGSSYYQAGGAL